MRRLLESALATASGLFELVYYIDSDDHASQREAERQQETGAAIQIIVGPRIVLSDCWNRCAEIARADILMHCGDDIAFRTPGWDAAVRDAFAGVPDRILFLHGYDNEEKPRGRFGTHGFLHRRWVDAVGYFVPPYFSCDWNDTWLNDVANALGRRLFIPIYTEHLHPYHGKGKLDQTHRERMARGQRDRVAQLYRQLAPKRQEDVEKLRHAISARSLERSDSHPAEAGAAL